MNANAIQVREPKPAELRAGDRPSGNPNKHPPYDGRCRSLSREPPAWVGRQTRRAEVRLSGAQRPLAIVGRRHGCQLEQGERDDAVGHQASSSSARSRAGIAPGSPSSPSARAAATRTSALRSPSRRVSEGRAQGSLEAPSSSAARVRLSTPGSRCACGRSRWSLCRRRPHAGRGSRQRSAALR